MTESYEYDIFGGVTSSLSSVGNPYYFTGRRYDSETGLYYYRARYYNPAIGRFLQTDPIGYDAGINVYTYCRNNPLVFVDPYGLEEICKIIWEEGGRFTIKTWIEKEVSGYWEAWSLDALAGLLSPEPPIGVPSHFYYTITYYLMALEGIYLDYYEVCYDKCSGEQTSKTFLFRTESGKEEIVVLKTWVETKRVRDW